MPENKQAEFVVTDRRKFTPEGELRPDAREEESPRAATPQIVEHVKSEPSETAPLPPAPASPPSPAAPTAEQQHAQKEAYGKSSRQLDEMLSAAGHPKAQDLEMNFQRVVESYYMTALMQMGAIGVENEEPRVDIIGARQTVDTLSILMEKTKGNLTPVEESLLQNALFELRMMFLEMTNAISRAAVTGNPKTGGITK